MRAELFNELILAIEQAGAIRRGEQPPTERGTVYKLKPQPGDIIIRDSGERLLVGDINELGGVCDDCTFDRGGARETVTIVRFSPRHE